MAKVKSNFFTFVFIDAHARGRQKRPQHMVGGAWPPHRTRGGGAVRAWGVAWFLGITLGTNSGS